MEPPNWEPEGPASLPRGSWGARRGSAEPHRVLPPAWGWWQGEGDIPGVVPLGLSQPCDPTLMGWALGGSVSPVLLLQPPKVPTAQLGGPP